MFGLLKKIANPFKGINEEEQQQNEQSQQQQQRNQQKQQTPIRKKEDDINFQIIDFQIDPMENIPRVFNYQNGKPDEEVVDYIEPKTQQDIQQQDKKNNNNQNQQDTSNENINSEQSVEEDLQKYIQYKVTPNDTLYQICDKFQVNLGKILKINSMSDDHIYAGMVLKIPDNQIQEEELVEEENKSDNMDNSRNKRKNQRTSVSQELISEQKISRQYHVSYCTGYGKILGKLQVQDDLIVFNPDMNDLDNRKKMKNKQIKFQATIDIRDVNEAIPMVLPPSSDFPDDELDENNKDYAVQICLSSVNKEISSKYKDKLIKLKQEKKSISFVTFKIYEYNKHGTLYTVEEKKEIADNIVKSIQAVLSVYYFTPEKLQQINEFEQSLTIVPFYDILYDNIIEKSENKVQKKNFWESLGIEPKIDEESQIVSKIQFLEILEKCVPSVFMINNWCLLYSNWQHGTSLNTLYRNCEENSPVLIFVQQFNGHFFGGYVTDPIQSGFKFSGSGESCVFRALKHEKQQELKKNLIQGIKQRKMENIQEIQENNNNKNNNSELDQTLQSTQNDEDTQLNQEESKNEDNELNEQELSDIQKQVDEITLSYGENIQVYTATGLNNNYQYSDGLGIGIGCGEKYSFFIKSNLEEGTSSESETYNSPQLSTKLDFGIQNIEIWGIQY